MINQSISAMQHGDHFCLFYRSPEEQLTTVIPFLSAGLKRGERCVHLGDRDACAQVSDGLAAAGVDVRAEQEHGALILESGHGHLVDGRFDPDAMMTFLAQIVEDTMAAGFTGWRATGDSHWEMGPEPDYPALERYEAMLDRFFHNRPMVGMCQHDLLRMPTEVLPALLASHRKVVVNGALTDSQYYRRPIADVASFLPTRSAPRGLHRLPRHLELMLSSIAEAVFTHDRRGHLIYANRAGRKLLAVPAYSAVFGEIAGPARHDLGFRGEHGQPLSPEDLPWRVALRERRPSEKFLGCPDPWLNRDRWWLAKAMPLFEGADAFDYCVSVIEDVTEKYALQEANERLEQKIAETERLHSHISRQDVLFREVHHRIKNNLQILSSLVTILGIRFPSSDVSDALHELEDRIGAISLVHELLYRQGKEATVDLGEYLRAVAESVWASAGASDKGIALTVDTAPCPASMDTAIPLGLILTEVLTNAVKHAFPSGRSGQVTVSLSRQGDRWRLVAEDSGVGTVPGSAPKDGIGCGLIRSLVSQLHGDMAIRSEQGTTFELTFTPRGV